MGNSYSTEYLSKIGARGGRKTLKRKGKKHFSKISKMRKTFGGGRPKKEKT